MAQAMTPAAFAIPGDITLPTGGYMYDRRVLALLAQFGVAAQHLELPGSFPDPTQEDLAEAERSSCRRTPRNPPHRRWPCLRRLAR